MNSIDYFEHYFRQMKEVIDAISREDLDAITRILFNAWQQNKNVFICGNGGSASTATHFTCDLSKTTIVENKKRFKVYCLNDNVPLITALVNDEGFDNLFYEQLKSLFQKGDVLICLSVHGGAGKDKAAMWSQNLLKAMKYAKDAGGQTIGFSGFDGGPMKNIADACVVVPANSTPQVESFHAALEHLICSCLRERIAESI